MNAICERTMIICSLICPEPTQMRIWLRIVRRMERASTWWKLSRSVAPRALRIAKRERHGHADHEHEGRLNQVPEDEAFPGNVIEPTRDAPPGGIVL